jgi:hypothetical protein
VNIFDWPLILFVFTFVLLWLSIGAGSLIRLRAHQIPENLREDYRVVLGSTLTLLGLIIGFTYSMASTRYDLRKSLEAKEANAIGTEYSRLDFLPEEEATSARELLRQYTDLRVQFYAVRSQETISTINTKTDEVGKQMWKLVSQGASANPSALSQLAATGMNEVLDSRDFTQAARWNRIPAAAWALMFVIAMLANMLLGYGAHGRAVVLSTIMPLIVAISFLLIADIDSPVGGIIRVHPDNLSATADSLRGT